MGAECCTERDGREEPGRRDQPQGYRAGRRFVLVQTGSWQDVYEPAVAGAGGDGAELGEGAFGRVRLVRHRRSLALYALKVVQKYEPDGTPRHLPELRHELETMACTDHPHVARLFEAFEDDEALHLVAEYCRGGDLLARLTQGAHANWSKGRGYNALGERQVAELLRQVLAAVAHVHALGLVHCDVKPPNFVLSSSAPDAQLKLIDFGTAKFSATESHHRVLGTPDYAAPEMLRAFLSETGDFGALSGACDIWAVGVIMHLMLTGTMPASANRKVVYYDATKFVQLQLDLLDSRPAYDFSAPEWQGISREAKQLVAAMLDPNPDERPTAARALQHVWIQQRASHACQGALDESHAARLTVFMRRTKLEQAALSLAVDRLHESEESRHHRDVWRALDTDCDGFVSLADVDAHLERTGFRVPQRFRTAITALAGPDGRVELNQFLAATLEPRKLHERRFAKMVFHALDPDSTGRLSAQELLSAIGDDCGVGPEGIDEQEFFALLDRSAARWDSVLSPLQPMPSAPNLSPPRTSKPPSRAQVPATMPNIDKG